MVTVKQLVEKLQGYPEDAVVVLSSDSEGNSFHQLSDVSSGSFDQEDDQFGLSELTPDLKEEGYSEDDLVDGLSAVCLWPA